MHRLGVMIVAGGLLALGGAARGSEPEGRLILRPSLVRQASGAALLRLDVTPSVNVTALRLTLQVPPGLEIHPRRFTGIAHSLGDLARGEPDREEFDVVVPQGAGRVLSIRLDGVDEAGRPFTQRIGVPIGVPGTAPQVRGGAAEFAASAPRPGDR
ncbi:MAG: hypothetical protein HY049_19290 [Acidobacteria bacterium]|nr:hypothetical protein [Acidobacteriota bacterium]